MAKQKIEKEFIYHGLGFPVLLKNVPMIELRGVWTPDINLNILQKMVLLGLAHQPRELTGNQIYFIRAWLGLNQVKFGHLLGVTHPAVVKWEKSENKAAKMTLSTQRDLRLLVLDRLLNTDEDFRKSFRIIHETIFLNQPELLALDAATNLVAI